MFDPLTKEECGIEQGVGGGSLPRGPEGHCHRSGWTPCESCSWHLRPWQPSAWQTPARRPPLRGHWWWHGHPAHHITLLHSRLGRHGRSMGKVNHAWEKHVGERRPSQPLHRTPHTHGASSPLITPLTFAEDTIWRIACTQMSQNIMTAPVRGELYWLAKTVHIKVWDVVQTITIYPKTYWELCVCVCV